MPEGRAGCRRLFFQEPEDPFFLGTRSLSRGLAGNIGLILAALVVTFLFQLICDEREVGKAFLGKGNLLVMEYGLLRDGRLGPGYPKSGGHFVPWFPVGIGHRDRGQGPGRFSLRDDDRCRTLLAC